MARTRLSLPHERRRAKLKSQQLNARVKIAEHREQLERITSELKAMNPPRPKPNTGGI